MLLKKVKKSVGLQTKIFNKNHYTLIYYNSALSFFSRFYSDIPYKWKFILMFCSGLISAFVSLLFVQNTGLYVSGLSGIFQGFARIISVIMHQQNYDFDLVQIYYQVFFYCFYLVVNIPLIIASYFLIGKKFTILSLIVVVTSTLVPLILNRIPNVNNFFIFGNTQSKIGYGVQLLNFQNNDGIKFIFILLYTLFAALLNGFSASLSYACGACNGGLDFLSFFYAYKKKKMIGKTLLGFNIVSILISTFIGSFLAAGIVDKNNFNIYNFFSQNLISALLYALILALVINTLFPKDKVVKIQIYCENVFLIRDYLYSIDFNHALTINTTIGGYSLKNKKNIEIVCFFIELPKILKTIKNLQQKTLTIIIPIKGIDGGLSAEKALN